MNEQANIDVIRRVYHAFVNGDSQGLLSCLAQDIAWEEPEVPNLPFAGKRQGRDHVAEFFRTVAALQQLRDFRPIEFIAQGDRVISLGHYEWTVRATGADWGSDWVHIFTVHDGKITHFREMADTHRVVEAYQAGQTGTARNIPVTDAVPPASIH
ncbi:MAG TPA: nuclear transport factor 2 family protein [Telluria sp.]